MKTSTERGRTYRMASTAKHAMYAYALVSTTFGIIGFWGTGWPIFLILILIAGALIYFGRRIIEDHAKVEDGVFIRYSGDRVLEEFDLRSIEEWALTARSGRDRSFSEATLQFKSSSSNKELKVHYSDNRDLFKDLLILLHGEKKNLTTKNPSVLEPTFPMSATDIRALLKNW